LTNLVNLVYFCSIKSTDMKTQCINLGLAASEISNLKNIISVKFILTNIASLKWPKVFLISDFSAKKIGHYLLPLIKQLFRDNFMGSEMEMSILLVLVKGYVLLAVHTIRHNAITKQFKKLSSGLTKNAVLIDKDFSRHRQAA